LIRLKSLTRLIGDDAKCNMGTVDIKLDKDFTVILISRY
jgi:hypothetical protein